jgi:hypothetical protein
MSESEGYRLAAGERGHCLYHVVVKFLVSLAGFFHGFVGCFYQLSGTDNHDDVDLFVPTNP